MKPQERADLTSYLIRLADGDRSAFDFIFEITWPLVHRFAQKMMSGSSEAEDIAQLALTKVFSRATEFHRDKDALSWILGITAFECRTARQKTKRRKEDFHSPENFDQKVSLGASIEEQLVSKAIENAIEDALNSLNSQDKETIKIAIYEMERPSIPAATFRKRLERAFDRLRDKWRSEYE